ncbi:MAG: protein-L-isoaspartate O-methyltransferase [Cocleimonas sp.]
MNYTQARFNMVEQQVRPWSVLDDTVLQTMGSIPRDSFVIDSLKSMAYADIEIPLEHGESMMFPRMEGRLLQELELDIEDECLEVGTGSGFVTACIATMAKTVHSIDIHDDFLQKAGERLAANNIANVILENKDAFSFDPSRAATKKYDAIAVTGSISEYLPVFEQLLKPGGRLFIVVGSGQTMHAMKVIRSSDKKGGDTFVRTSLFETELAPLAGVEKKTTFSF